MAGFYAHVEKKHREVGPLGLEADALERLERVLQQAAMCLHLRADWGGAALHLRSALLQARMAMTCAAMHAPCMRHPRHACAKPQALPAPALGPRSALSKHAEGSALTSLPMELARSHGSNVSIMHPGGRPGRG
jgi:hypothetical protein